MECFPPDLERLSAMSDGNRKKREGEDKRREREIKDKHRPCDVDKPITS
jgi:hypothetical protein